MNKGNCGWASSVLQVSDMHQRDIDNELKTNASMPDLVAGTVGQRFIVLLSKHPNFQIHALGASSRSAGQEYAKVTKWKQAQPVPKAVRAMVVKECKSAEFQDCDVVFSGLDHDVAGPIGWLASSPRQVKSC